MFWGLEEHFAFSPPTVVYRKAALAAVSRIDSRDGELATLVYSVHFCRLFLPIIFVVLNNAQSINPEVGDLEVACHLYGVLQGPG